MRKRNLLLGFSGCSTVLGVAAGVFFAASVSASTVRLDTTSVSTTGGAFKATVSPGSSIGIYGPGDTFYTFCVEVNEEFNPGGTYSVVASNESVFGGGSTLQDNTPYANQYGSTGFVPLQAQVAYLYSNFMHDNMSSVMALEPSEAGIWSGSLAGLDAASAQSLQNAIWYFMGYQAYNASSGYIAGNTSITKKLEDAANRAVNGFDIANGLNDLSPTWHGLGDVRVMQMWYHPEVAGNVGNAAYKSQDQLVLVPTPAASFAGLGLLGSLALVGFHKRRQNAQDSSAQSL